MDRLIPYGKTIIIHTPSNKQLSDDVLSIRLTSIVLFLPHNICTIAIYITLILIKVGKDGVLYVRKEKSFVCR